MFQMDIGEEANKVGMKTTKKKGQKKTVASSTTTAAITSTCDGKKRGRAAPVRDKSPRRKSERANLGRKKNHYE